MLRRIFAYANKLFDLPAHFQAQRDGRKQPKIPTGVVAQSAMAMMLARLGGLNALEQTGPSRCWKTLLKADLPSPDTIGRVCQVMENEPIRQMLSVAMNLFTAFYKRNLKPTIRNCYDTLAIGRQMLAELCVGLPIHSSGP